ncbi:sugar transferase [Enterococcus avium]|uniref:sugar transferase n=1 Tax=Enterococcus avium TaxID=33945 RepID=UPI00232E78C1|nr:sugar transferase [Enterococcus avium]MDB1750811.1 sugar transferase [Enterococcus avium]MDB1754867.1 sugar transferase [Enterococcus avium]MDB1761953.1 sugar transferase [Enterococcus avium]
MSKNREQSKHIFYRFIKRSFDIIFSIFLIIPVGLVLLISAILIKIEDNGPLFYMADRTGRFGKPFKMFKLRSMKVDAPDIRLADGSTYNGKDDPRITKFGKFARKSSIDELPQIINILKGDMTFIGPRPDTPMYLDKYTEEEKIILTVRPGVTGYNQAINRNTVGTKEKLANDIYYVKHMSVKFDIRIIFMTIKIVLNGKDVYRSDEESIEISKNLGEKNV